MEELNAVVESVLAEPFWGGAIAAGVITEAEAKALIPVVLVTPDDMETPTYLASLLDPMQRMLDWEGKSAQERTNG